MKSNAPSEILLSEIQTQSQTEADAVLEQAKKEANELLNTARKNADKTYQDIIQKAEAQASNIQKRILSSVHLEIKKQNLRARETMIQKILDEIWNHINTFRKSKEYAPVLKEMILEGVAALDGNEMLIMPGEAERQLITTQMIDEVESQVKGLKLKLSDSDISEAGLVISTGDGRTRFDNRFSARIKRFQETIRLAIFKDIIEI